MINKIITISSAKGGVGKSTISAWLAKHLSEQGKAVGLLDADIYGPSIPTILQIANNTIHQFENLEPKIHEGKILPLEVMGIKVMSIAFLANNAGAFAWRGPMLAKAISQMFESVAWGKLDYLIVDTPPGTGDVHLSIFAKYKIDGAIIVTIPSNISKIDVQRCIDLHRKFNINIYGIVENMSYYETNGDRFHPFGQGAGQSLSKEFNLKLIDQLPLIDNLSNISFADLDKALSINLTDIGL